jgi:hypothetical protein
LGGQLWTFVPAPAKGWFFITSAMQTENSVVVIEIKGGRQEKPMPLQVNVPKTKDDPGGNDYQLWQLQDESGKSVPPPPTPPTPQGGWPGLGGVPIPWQ